MANGFRKAFNIYAWIWNHLWGTLFLAGGVLALANADDVPVYIGLMSIVIGIYFYWSKSWSRAAKKAADAVYDRTRQADAPPAQATGQPAGAPPAPASAAPAESDPVTAKRITIARIAGVAVAGGAFLWESSGISSDSMPIFLGMLGVGLALLSVPGYIVRLLPSAATPRVGPAASDTPEEVPPAAAEIASTVSTTTAAPGEPAATPAVRMSALNWVGAGLFMVCVVWIGVGVRLTMLPVWLGLVVASGALFYAGSRSSKGAASAPRPPVPHSQKSVASAGEQAFPAEAITDAVLEPSPEDFEAPTDLASGVPSARVTSPRFVARGVAVVAALVIVGIVGAGFLSQVRRPQVAVEADSEPSAELVSDPADEPYDPLAGAMSVDVLTGDTKARSEIELFNSAPSDGSMEFVDVVYADGGQKMGYIYLEFALVSRDPGEWYITVFDEGAGFYIDHEPVEPSEFYSAIDSAVNGEFARGMIVFDNEGVYELHVFTQGQKAAASAAGGEPAPGADMASSEGDTVSFVEFVQDEGGSLLINAEPDGERVYSRPSIMMVRSAEPFFEWAIPLSDSYEYSIGDRPVTGYELFEYISSQGLVRVDVVCDDGRIVSISCWEE